ncbi:hypothetical protein AKJ35_00980 [candidate division MSBL1 archaeon SCGC-AAA833F18]|uniref:Cation/H+ exchanger transmembrane domain-containing protein n=2 Tax=candidate division MSBL1 TaxID=215777 RepID=A0A133VSE8_9EURY|nr:hypothetical protein AKJ47_02950 [candidate division MSBL1 archaeon SCGC-AAA261G05]KXB09341.1 hypothetical protein AKJ35_00980 [candidate division MSBL1 archaeon SCGC-AAA833F18]
MLNVFLLVGLILALGFSIGRVTHKIKITAIVGYIIAGIILGPEVLDVPAVIGIGEEAFSTIWDITTFAALALIGFVIGMHLTKRSLGKHTKFIMAAIIGECLGAFLLVFLGVLIFTHDLPTALLLASLAPASAPAGAVATLHEYRAKGPLTNAIYAVVGWDDALAVIIFAISLAFVGSMLGGAASLSATLIPPLREVLGGMALGAGLGLVMVFLMRKIGERDSIFITSLAIIFIGAGLAVSLEFSLILTCMIIGIFFVNFSHYDNRPRKFVEYIMPPIYILFFTLAGMSLDFNLLLTMGLLGLVYILCRAVGLIGGTSLATRAAGGPSIFQKYLGFGILSQAGVAIGLAALAGSRIAALPGGPELASLALTMIMATTIVFEIIGPIGVRFAIGKAGEIRKE